MLCLILCPRFRLSGLMGLLLIAFTVQCAVAQPTDLDDEAAKEAFRAYTVDIQSRREQNLPLDIAFYERWERAFSDVHANTSSLGRHGVAMLSELGAIQRLLGMEANAYATWQDMGHAAMSVGDRFATSVAMNNLIMMSRSKDTPELDHLTLDINAVFTTSMSSGPPPTAADLAAFSDTYAELGRVYLRHGQAFNRANSSPNNEQEKQNAFLRSAEALERSLTLQSSDDTHNWVMRNYMLGQARIGGGDRVAAAKIFQSLADIEQDVISKMHMAHEALKATWDFQTPEYIRGLEQILKEYEPDDYILPLTQHLGFSYMRAGHYEKAASIFESLIGLDEDPNVNASNMITLAEIYAAQGDFASAEAILKAVQQDYPETPSSRIAQRLLGRPLREIQQRAKIALERIIEESIAHIDHSDFEESAFPPEAKDNVKKTEDSHKINFAATGTSQITQSIPPYSSKISSYLVWGVMISAGFLLVGAFAYIGLRRHLRSRDT